MSTLNRAQEHYAELLDEARVEAERKRPGPNNQSAESIEQAKEFGIDLTVCLNVISKSKHRFGEAVSLTSNAINYENVNPFARSVLNDLATEREQADHSISGGNEDHPNFGKELMNKLKGDYNTCFNILRIFGLMYNLIFIFFCKKLQLFVKLALTHFCSSGHQLKSILSRKSMI
jgi:pyruvate formate-lyase activating enzyme-like uncharacterized protein